MATEIDLAMALAIFHGSVGISRSAFVATFGECLQPLPSPRDVARDAKPGRTTRSEGSKP